MEYDEAINSIAAILAEWFEHVDWTPEMVAEIDELAQDGRQEEFPDPSAHYAEFALVLLRRLDLLAGPARDEPGQA